MTYGSFGAGEKTRNLEKKAEKNQRPSPGKEGSNLVISSRDTTKRYGSKIGLFVTVRNLHKKKLTDPSF